MVKLLRHTMMTHIKNVKSTSKRVENFNTYSLDVDRNPVTTRFVGGIRTEDEQMEIDGMILTFLTKRDACVMTTLPFL